MGKGFGELFLSSWEEYRKNFLVFLIIFLLLSLIPSIILYLLGIPITSLNTEISNLGKNSDPVQLLDIFSKYRYNLLISFVFFIISILLSVWMYSSLTYNSLYRKKSMSVKESLRGGWKYYLRYLLFGIVSSIFLIGLFLLLIIPGVIFMVFWIFSVYILVGENKGIIDSLKGSYRLVKGRWWRTFGFLLLFFLICIIIFAFFGLVSDGINYLINPQFVLDKFSKNPNYTFNNIVIINELIGVLFSFTASLIVIPFVILFLKNFYIDSKKGK